MNIKNNPILWPALMILVTVVCVATATVAVAEPIEAPAGNITLVIGQAYAINAKGQKRRLKQSGFIFEGDSVVTNRGAHVHIKFIDDARISIRPESRLNIETYHYDRETPKNSEIRFYLHKGVLRSISGKATEAAHERYRMNTPIAALGVLGTDYVVRTDLKTTWAAVYSGAISLAPISNSCNHLGLGTCANATELTAKMDGKYLEVNIGDARSRLKSQINESQYEQADGAAPESDVEQEVKKGSEDENALTSKDTLADLPHDQTDTQGQGNGVGQEQEIKQGVVIEDGLAGNGKLAILSDDQADRNIGADNDDVVQPPVLSTGLAWVRWPWQTANATDTVSQEKSSDNEEKKITIGNSYAGLFRAPSGLLELQPQQGVFNFNLQNSHVVFVQNGEQWQNATEGSLDKANLQIDFGKRKFNTQLEIFHQQTGAVDLNVTGEISNDGLFRGKSLDDSVAGALTLDGNNAGMQFQKNLGNGSLQGITEWQR